MSDEKPKTRSEILSELDRLKDLLEQDRSDSDDDDIPVLSEVVEVGDEPAPAAGKAVSDSTKQQSAKSARSTKLPTGDELNKLIDSLVNIQIRKLRPVIQKEVVRLILERYPDLK